LFYSRDNEASARFRAARLAALRQLLPYAAVAHVAGATTASLLFWRNGDHTVLTLAPVLLAAAYLVVAYRVWWLSRKRIALATRAEMVFSVAVAVALGLTSAILPASLIPNSTGAEALFLGGLDAALMAGSTFAADFAPAALTFLVLVWAGTIYGTMGRHAPTLSPRGVGSTLYALVIAIQVLALARRQKAAYLDRVELNQQREVTSLLLSDFEESARDWLWELDVNGLARRVSQRLVQITGIDSASLQRVSILPILKANAWRPGYPGEGCRQVLRAIRANRPFRGAVLPIDFGDGDVWAVYSGKPILDAVGATIGYRGVGSDLTALIAGKREIEYLSSHDALTELPNRHAFSTALQHDCDANGEFCLLYLDLDRFKAINDTHGHPVGDALLRIVGQKLQQAVRSLDVVARIGGDEFAILLRRTNQAGAKLIAARLLASINSPIEVGNLSLCVGASIGIAVQGSDGISVSELMRAADLALYDAKARGGDRSSIFDEHLSARARSHDELLLDLRGALERRELHLDFQPILDFATGRPAAVEALIRWTHPQRGLLNPSCFIPVAEESGLIRDIGAWVLREACQAGARLPADVGVCVNVSPLQVRGDTLITDVELALQQSGMRADRLALEITESVFLDFEDTTQSTLRLLRARGIKIVLDDFGAGYSSLSYLRRFPFDGMKIDKSFLQDISRDADQALFKAVLAIGGALGIATTVEGIETTAHVDWLKAIGCGYVQGFLLGHPVAAPALPQAMQDATRRWRQAMGIDVALTQGIKESVLF
jgi:diguanylate cyclase (GGDEF)-like protein